MAGWICQTRKMLSTVIASLADDLEQTVQDFNDAIQRLNATNVSGASDTVQPVKIEHPNGAANEKPLLASDSPQLQVKQSSALTQHYSATTRQPVTSAIQPAIKKRLSQSTRSLKSADDQTQKPAGERQACSVDPLVNHTSVAARPPPCGPLSPCLTGVSVARPESEHQNHAHDKSALSSSDRGSVSLDRCSIPCPFYPNIRSPRPSNVCPCHQKEPLDPNTKTFGFKRPGKVIRAHTLAKEGQCLTVTHDLSLNVGQELPVADIHKEGYCMPDQNGSSSHAGRSSSLVPVEKEACLLRWTSLWPLTSMLSYAVSQLTNLVHLLTDEHRNFQSLTSREDLFKSSPRNNAKVSETVSSQDQAASASVSNDAVHDDGESTIHGRTYSTESFVVIGSPICHCALGEHRVDQDQPSDGDRSVDLGYGLCAHLDTECLERNVGWSASGPCVGCGQVTEVISSSVEWASFDVGKLIKEHHSDDWRSISEQSKEPGRIKLGEASLRDEVLGGSGSDFVSSSSGVRGGAARSDYFSEITKGSEDDCDSSVSIISLSDVDDNSEDGFILF